MISKLFLQAVKLCLSASIVTGLVLLLRLTLKKAPKSLVCALWILVGLRLMIPAMPSSKVSVIPEAVSGGTAVEALEKQYVEETTVIRKDQNEELYEQITELYKELPVYQEKGTSYVVVAGPAVPAAAPASAQSAVPAAASYTPPKTFGDSVVPALSVVWIAGVGVMLLYMIGSYLRLYRRLRTAVIREKGVWESDQISSPFILGILRPRIYLPMSLSEEERQFVLAHERTHIRRGDQIWKPLSFVLLAVYWFNPLFWLAYFLVCRDIESACDESVIRSEGTAYRKAYSETLLKLNVRQKAVTACPLAFAENSVGGRIRSILNYKKPAFWLVVTALVISVVAAGCALTDPTKKETPAPESTEQTASEASTEESTAPESTEAVSTDPAETTEAVPTETETDPAPTEHSAETEPVSAERTACTTVLLEGPLNDEKTGVIYGILPGCENRGPTEFAVISESDILILDIQASRLQRYKDGQYFETISLPDKFYLRLCVIGETAYVLTSDSLLEIDLNTKEQSIISLPFVQKEDPDYMLTQYAENLFEQDGKLYLVTREFGSFCLNEETQKVEPVSADTTYTINRSEDEKQILVTEGNRNWTINDAQYYQGNVIGFEDDVLYFCMRDPYPHYDYPDIPWAQYCHILKCVAGKDGAEESFVEVFQQGWGLFPWCFARVAGDGYVYTLVLRDETFAVYKLKVGYEDIVSP